MFFFCKRQSNHEFMFGSITAQSVIYDIDININIDGATATYQKNSTEVDAARLRQDPRIMQFFKETKGLNVTIDANNNLVFKSTKPGKRIGVSQITAKGLEQYLCDHPVQAISAAGTPHP